MHTEKARINQIGNIIRFPNFKLNKPYECDCELIQFENNIIGISSDTLSEEIECNIFNDLYSIGWYAAIMTISDIFATGNTPKGLLVNLSLPKSFTHDELYKLINGIEDCCKRHNTYILGGDTNEANTLSISTFGISNFYKKNPVKRSGMNEGDFLFVTSNVGLGNYTAFLNSNYSANSEEMEEPLLPILHPKFPELIASFASSSIDTSDGLIHAAFDLLEQNPTLGLSIHSNKIPYCPFILKTAKKMGIPEIVFCGGEVGDYGVLFTVKSALADEMISYYKQYEIPVSYIGNVTSRPGLDVDNKLIYPFAEKISKHRNTPSAYVSAIMQALS